MEPKVNLYYGGVADVAYNLPRALANKIGVTYFPAFFPRRSYVVNFLNVYRGFATRNFDIVQFNVPPSWISGSYTLFKFAKLGGASTIFNVHGIIQVEHLFDYRRRASSKGVSHMLRCCKIADKIATYSEFMRTNIVTWYGVSRDKIVVIPNGVNFKRFSECNKNLLLSRLSFSFVRRPSFKFQGR